MEYQNQLENSLFEDGVRLKKAANITDFHNGTVFEIENESPQISGTSNLETVNVNNFPEGDDDICDPLLLNSLSGVSNKYNENEQGSFSDAEDDTMEPFEKLARKMEDISGDEGVLKMELQGGVGPDIPKEAQVIFHYSAYLEYADEPFDSTVLRNQPQRAYLNEEDTFRGIKIGLRTMRKKEKARFLISPQYAFGELGCPPRIPPRASILYDITLVDWNDRSGADTFENLEYEQKVKLSFEQKMKAASDYHKEGNDLYKQQQLQKAKVSYRRATWILENMRASDAEEEHQQSELLFRMRSNLAQINLELKEFGRACTECRLALEFSANVEDELKAKLFFRFGKAKMFLNDFDISRKYLLKAQRLRPNNIEISNLLEDLLKRTKKYNDREKVICQKMMGIKVKNTESTESSSSKMDNANPLVKRIIETQLKSLREDDEREGFSLPPNLTSAEIHFATSLAKDFNLRVEKHHLGSSIIWKVVRS